MTILFKPKHIPMILSNPPTKVQTRRFWARERTKLGRTYWASTAMIQKTGRFAKLRVNRSWWEVLHMISRADAIAEGYPDQKTYLTAVLEINKAGVEALAQKVCCLEFEVVGVVKGQKWCRHCGFRYPSDGNIAACYSCRRDFVAVDTSHLAEVEV